MRTALLLAVLAVPLLSPAQPAGKAVPKDPDRTLSLESQPWKGDFDKMLERRMIRVLVPYSRTLFYVDKGAERGLTAETVRDFERYLNRKYAKQLGKRPLTVFMIPTARDQLLERLRDGHGDIAAGNLTVTAERLELVDFAGGKNAPPVNEVVVTGPRTKPIAKLDDLAGRTVHVRPSSSYHASLLALNERLGKAGKKEIDIEPLPEAVEDEDALEMLNAGLLRILVVDDWKAKLWAQMLPKVKVRTDLVLRTEGRIAWAVRKGSPKLRAAIDEALARPFGREGDAVRLAAQQKRLQQISNNTDRSELKRFQQTVQLFEKYGTKYGFDPLMLAAQGYQESGLNQQARSPSGAIGVMQIMPATGKSLQVGDIRQIEPNIHAGAKYMDQLMTQYFPDAKFSEGVRPLFAFASYNAGPGNIVRMRELARRRGLDPDKWFNNVEIVVAEKIGIETTMYVRNIYKYYTAYRLAVAHQDAARRARERVG